MYFQIIFVYLFKKLFYPILLLFYEMRYVVENNNYLFIFHNA